MTKLPHFMADVSQRLRSDPPGHAAHLAVAPDTRASEADLSPDGKAGRQAAVFILLGVPDGTTPHPITPPTTQPNHLQVLFIKRPKHLKHHAGQMAFPGGACERGETTLAAAFRECHEEIGVDASQIQVIGKMTPLYIPPSKFVVNPYLGYLPTIPDLTPSPDEVSETVWLSIADLLSPRYHFRETWTLQNRPCVVPGCRIGPHTIWGASMMMLNEMLDVFRSIGDPGSS